MTTVPSQPATIRVEEAAGLLDVSRDLAYREIRDKGELNGIKAIRVGRRLILPRRPFMESLGLTDATSK